MLEVWDSDMVEFRNCEILGVCDSGILDAWIIAYSGKLEV